jgi:hypothetical protein
MSFEHVPYTSNATNAGSSNSAGATGNQGTQGAQNFLPFSIRNYKTLNTVIDGSQGVIPPPKQSTSIASLEDLMNTREATLNKEISDKKCLDVLLTPTSDTFRTSLLQWAAKDFPSGYILHSINLNAPLVCSDGSSHDIGGYVLFLTKKSSEDIAKDIQSLMPGIKVFHSFLNSSIRIHISKL